jgi:hypothetical protein
MQKYLHVIFFLVFLDSQLFQQLHDHLRLLDSQIFPVNLGALALDQHPANIIIRVDCPLVLFIEFLDFLDYSGK